VLIGPARSAGLPWLATYRFSPAKSLLRVFPDQAHGWVLTSFYKSFIFQYMKHSQPRQTAARHDGPRSLLAELLETAGAYEARIEDALKVLGLSKTLYVTLAQLANANGPLTLRELAEGQHCAPSNITQKMDRLEKDGFVRRVDDPGDRRSIRAELTELGRERAAAAMQAVGGIQSDLESLLSASEREALGRLLAGLR
jgi:DNA-binding MarR family transcriptional regulator